MVPRRKEPTSIDCEIVEAKGKGPLLELKRYQEQGRLIRVNCATYCDQILDKIDAYYSETAEVLPFICVEGSSGMGKSQLAFALYGRRPYFYWLGGHVQIGDQVLYMNFSSASDAFLKCVENDRVKLVQEDLVLRTESDFYRQELWAYGFIRVLLERCDFKKRGMIRFEEPMALHVTKCDREAVRAAVSNVEKGKGNKLPFFILDEMPPDSDGGLNEAAFQRNVFRACGLLVMLMGTDSKITNLVNHSTKSSGAAHQWVSVVPRFPSYQLLLFTQNEKNTWPEVVGRYSVLGDIAENSRGRFSRLFIDEVVDVFQRDPSVDLCELLDTAFSRVAKETHNSKHFLNSYRGKSAQLLAISYTNAMECESVIEPPQKKQRVQVQTTGMHKHFANLVDKEVTDVSLSNKKLVTDAGGWAPKCSFSAIEDDMLLYLAILGGKRYSSYYDDIDRASYSTKRIFSIVYCNEYAISESTSAPSLDYKRYENMVAHAIFSSSRRNGVRGIGFDDFFQCFLGEFEENTWMQMAVLLEKDVPAHPLTKRKIPFLAPPNAEWPQCILATNLQGCKFGHLVRAPNKDRCDVYVQDVDNKNEKAMLIFECKYRKERINIGVMKGIVDGLNSEWEGWELVVVFCVELAAVDWQHKSIGCVRISRGETAGTVIARWVFQPEQENRKQLVIVIETGEITSSNT
ncbi:hypothetical protein PHYSODRAFT_469425 [Phytophthora sojae]|uniref:Crinkler (CRN) family protein n=1 Tax=Phytophthora sojae (strain P6497) TaxID=1094619 RepID=G4YL71_PHYSP|nr:hypothetical protein PHYSODRAFT_469425 [Phytophthora sojae]EGZ29986.1 hypothetical protein PHYSODRAFT_469425 [Phytophthora sojae]|eukprot:XP_009517261.1 hypothetical protein PHYSODRAFT_469425 [Phytophthora sojae]